MKKHTLSQDQIRKIRIFKTYWMPRLGRSDFQDQKVLEENKSFRPFSLGISTKNA